MSKVDPSFKSKRYRDKLRTEIKGLECLIPIDRSVLHRKLDSQTVFRLIISYFRLKVLFKSIGIPAEGHDDAESSQKEASMFYDNFDGQNMNQIMDGFLMVVTTDGTILYTTENVLQYLGFNQVDLMHRCLYGLVHQDDHFELKSTIENPQSQDTTRYDYMKSDKQRHMSFICRMKCFSGSSAGYLKMHCSGKMLISPHLTFKSSHVSQNVLLLYCQPFMLSGNDVTNDAKQNVFWSKHDMDLRIRDLDKKAESIIGYAPEEMTDKSLYSVVHPEDLAIFAACHKSLMDSTEVQSMYFRVICKEEGFMWLHSRGKVVSKNSKKFSIVFTHCPVREEDSAFLQQESVMRQRYGINDLLYFVQFGHFTSSHSVAESDSVHSGQKTNYPCTPHMGFTEDVSLPFYSSLTTCPSSWHAMSDRHSPVLPSTHVAHKITQKEKQLQFQEFRRRQQIQCQYQPPTDYPRPGARHGDNYSQHIHGPRSAEKGENVYCTPEKQIKTEPCVDEIPDHGSGNLSSSSGRYNPQVCRNNCCSGPLDGYIPNCGPCIQRPRTMVHNAPGYISSPYMFNYIPIHIQQNIPTEHQYPNMSYHDMNLPHRDIGQNRNIAGRDFDEVYSHHHGFERYPSPPRQYFRTLLRPPTNIKLSMHCDYNPPSHVNHLQFPVDSKHFVLQDTMNNRDFRQPQDITMVDGTSCAVAASGTVPPPEEVIQYDIEASIHMKIVDNSGSKFRDNPKPDPDLPSIGSFLEYLNDS